MIIKDKEFGEIIVRRNSFSRNARFSISTSGRLQVSVPSYASDFLVKRFINSSRAQIRRELPLKDPATQRARDAKKKILAKRAKEYLPYRLNYYATKYDYHYDKLKFSHASTRWWSCTHRPRPGNLTEIVISLNIGLMQVPEPLRDYVILHELAHINHPDHSPAFWAEVATHDPRYKTHRTKLKSLNPGV